MLKVLAVISSILYPLIIFTSLRYFNASPRVLALVLMIVAMVYFISNTGNIKKKGFKSFQLWATIIIATTLALLTFLTENSGYVMFYPVFISMFFLLSFSITLKSPPTMIFRFATLADKTIIGSDNEKRVESYCLVVTKIWIIFFVINGVIALTTAIYGDYEIWTLYNGLISYICMGLIFCIEFIVRKVKI